MVREGRALLGLPATKVEVKVPGCAVGSLVGDARSCLLCVRRQQVREPSKQATATRWWGWAAEAVEVAVAVVMGAGVGVGAVKNTGEVEQGAWRCCLQRTWRGIRQGLSQDSSAYT